MLCVTIAAAWLLSRWRGVHYGWRANGGYRYVEIRSGAIFVGGLGPPYVVNEADIRLRLTQNPLAMQTWFWRPTYSPAGSGAIRNELSFATVPLWLPCAVAVVSTAFLFYRDRRSARRSREGRCVGCGYDLSGVSAKCPECGREAAWGCHDAAR